MVTIAGCGLAGDDAGGAAPEEPAATATDALRIDFQPRDAATSPGYFPDTGEVFGERGNGLHYGWTIAHTESAYSFERPFSALDVRLWTLIEMDGGAAAAWEIAVPTGSYLVTVVAGGPQVAAPQRVSVEGVPVLDVTPGDYAPWVKGSAVVFVSDGRLSLANPGGGPGTRLCSVDIVRQ
ncbi:MAG TPA: hypothetical protein VFH68_01125 [Polyangia bacterium]|nr:hypothetical protein [Polyangia bacterium]